MAATESREEEPCLQSGGNQDGFFRPGRSAVSWEDVALGNRYSQLTASLPLVCSSLCYWVYQRVTESVETGPEARGKSKCWI